MHLATVLHLLIALAYALAGRTAGRRGEHERAVEALSLAALYMSVALVDLPLLALVGPFLPGLA